MICLIDVFQYAKVRNPTENNTNTRTTGAIDTRPSTMMLNHTHVKLALEDNTISL